jgi:hypothetical protein
MCTRHRIVDLKEFFLWIQKMFLRKLYYRKEFCNSESVTGTCTVLNEKSLPVSTFFA